MVRVEKDLIKYMTVRNIGQGLVVAMYAARISNS